MAELNQFMNKAFDYEEKGFVEEAILLCNKCMDAFPEYRNEIAFEIAKMHYRNGKEEDALNQFLNLYQKTENMLVHDLVLEAYYGVKQQEYEERYHGNLQLIKEYPYFWGNSEPAEICYYPIWIGEDLLWYYDSMNSSFHKVERCRLSIGEPKRCICLGSGLLWMEDILLLEKMSRIQEPLLDMENPLLLLYEKGTWELLLQLLDLRTLIEFDRIMFFDESSKLEDILVQGEIYFPSMIVGSSSSKISNVLNKGLVKVNQEFIRYKKRALEYYCENGENIIKHIKQGKPKVLIMTSRFTTALQYHARDCRMAMDRMGMETELFIEKDRLGTGCTSLSVIKKIADFKPDIIFEIDHFRHEQKEVEGLENIVWISWVQDPMPAAMSAETPLKLTDKDFIMNHYISSKRFRDIGYSEKCLIDAPIPANSYIYKPYRLKQEEIEKYACDICFVCHSSDVERKIDEVLKQVPAFHDEIYAIYKGYQKYVYETGNMFYTREEFGMYIERALLHHYNIMLTPESLKFLTDDMWTYFNQAVFRQALVDWILDAGFTNIKLWGNGWTTEEKYKKYAMGPAKNGETLSKIYQASKIVLGNNIITTAAARAWESMLSGAFYLSNYIPEENDDVDIRKIIEVGKDVIMFYNREDLIEKLHYYLGHEDERQEMIKRGREAALEKMTYDVLMKRVLKEVAERLEENTNG